MSIQVKNLSQLQHKLRGVPESVTNVVIDEIQAKGVDIRDRAKLNAPVDTGELRDSIKKRREARGLNARVNVGAWYGRLIEFGSKAHTLKPKRKKAMAGDDFGPVSGAVQHPGTPARPFLHPAYREETKDFDYQLARAISTELRRVAR